MTDTSTTAPGSAPESKKPNSFAGSGTAVGAGGSAASSGIVVVWLLRQFHIDMPAEVALAIIPLLMPFYHALINKYGVSTS